MIKDGKMNQGSTRGAFLTVLFVGSVALSLLILWAGPMPFFWIFVIWAVALFWATFGVQGSWLRAIFVNLGIVACLLAGTETYLTLHEYTSPVTPPGFWAQNDVLGWAPTKGMRFHVFKYNPTGFFHGPRGLLFDDYYTIDSDGLRVSPPWQKNDLETTVIFFGCSFTFGEGLRDNETLPYQVGEQAGGKVRSVNFAFEGYSAAQMLAQIENGIVSRDVDTAPQYAFYVAIPSHVWRVAGRVGWGMHAPRYGLGADGTVRREGFFETGKSLGERIGLRRGLGQLNKSAIWRALSSSEERVTDHDIQLYIAVVRRSQELLQAEFPGIKFEVILWPNQDLPQQLYVYNQLREGFLHAGIPFVLVEDILPGYKKNRSPYILGSSDHHPNALADHILAHYALSNILHSESSN
jgi:hypothetical protein